MAREQTGIENTGRGVGIFSPLASIVEKGTFAIPRAGCPRVS